MSELVDKIFSICKNHKNMLNDENEIAIKAMINTVVSKKEHEPTKEDIMKVFLGHVNLSEVSAKNIDCIVENIRAMISKWEKYKNS